ncbi:MAG: HD domain-containing protein [Chitinophagales bacterium]
MLYHNNAYIEDILARHRQALGPYYEAYRNHVYRVFNLSLQLCPVSGAEEAALAVAAAFHDIGIWAANTFDYLPPSIALARAYAVEKGLGTQAERIAAIIDNHHKLSRFTADGLTEAFRKADLIDLSFNVFRFGVKGAYLKELNAALPGKGFHRVIFGRILKNSLQHPLNPLPMVKF